MDYLEFLKAMEELLRKGLIEEVYEDGELKYGLTDKGVEAVEKIIRESPDAFDFYLELILRNSKSFEEFLQRLLLIIYRIFYNIPYEEAVKRAKKWFEGENNGQ